MECGMRLVKFLVFIFNFVLWVCGLALVVLGVIVQLTLHNTFKVKDLSASGAPILIIAIGVIIFIVAFFGCCGAFQESYWMITVFALLMCLIIIGEIAAAALGYLYRGKISMVVKESLVDMIENYNTSKPEFRLAVDKLQSSLKCCGINSTADWKSFAPDGMSVPDSCCMEKMENCGQGAMNDASKVYQKGCKMVFIKLLQKNLQYIIIAASVIAVLQVMGVVCACFLMKEIKSSYAM